MLQIPGTPLSGKITIGKLRIIKQKKYKITHKHIYPENLEAELLLFEDALRHVEAEYLAFIKADTYSELDKEIFQTHLLIVNDPDIKSDIIRLISQEKLTAANAVFTKYNSVIKDFQQMENDFFAQRQDDYKDVGHKLMIHLLGEKAESIYFPGEIICQRDVTPSQITKLAKMGVSGLVTDSGSINSHSAILARALGFTALVIPAQKFQTLTDGSIAIIDADQGMLITEPDADVTLKYKQTLERLTGQQEWLEELIELPAITQNNVAVSLKANIELIEELALIIKNKFAGVGLYRTEYIYLSRQSMPDENEQFLTYKTILTKLQDMPVTIRTFDLGGDKLPGYGLHLHEDNPNLGCRGIRFSLYQKPMFKVQLRAILRASVKGKVRIMFPMIIDTGDFLRAKAAVQEAMAELDAEGIAYDPLIPLGVMIETPAAALCADSLASICDFFSIGTNDLVQYTLAVDRNNERVAEYYNQSHPAVIHLIRLTLAAAARAGIPVSVCGEMASTPRFVPLFVGLGVSELSINPSCLPVVKSIIRNCDVSLFETVQSFDFACSALEINTLLDTLLQRYCPHPV